MRTESNENKKPASRPFFGLLVFGGTMTLPILLVLMYFYLAGFSERSLQQNVIYPTLFVTFIVMEILEAVANWSVWDRFVPKMSITWRKAVARNATMAFGFGCIIPQDAVDLSAYLREWAIAIPIIFGILCAVDLAIHFGRRYWQQRQDRS